MGFNEDSGESQDEKPLVPRTAVSLQRMKLEKLMKNPDKPIIIPERHKDKKLPHVPDFVRNVMGSSAGAGSGEFHVYRHLRRKEYARQKIIQEKGAKGLLDDDYQKKIEENQKVAEEKTSKKRTKRQKNKEKLKKKKLLGLINKPQEKEKEHSDHDSSSENNVSEDESINTEKNVNDSRLSTEKDGID